MPIWNWQLPEWPSFRFNAHRLAAAEEQFAQGAGALAAVIRHAEPEAAERVYIERMADEAVTTSTIEGETLARESVQSSVRRALGLSTPDPVATPAERGIAELMVDVCRTFADPLDAGTLLRWHRMVMRGRPEMADVGAWRTHPEPMQVVSGRIDFPTVHFEAPPASRVPAEMERFIEWFNRTAPDGPDRCPVVTRAGLAHLYFESIHPFEDGNGRIGRAIAEKVMSQSLGQPTLTAIAATILVHRKDYYLAIEATNKKNEITRWLAWFAGIALEAQALTLAQVEFLIAKTRLFDQYRDRLNPRQTTVLRRVLREGPAGFKGGLSAGKYVSIAKTSPATAGRDLAEMVELGALTRTGEKRHTRYHLPFPLRPVPRFTIGEDGEVRMRGVTELS
jgi:Fic family protein